MPITQRFLVMEDIKLAARIGATDHETRDPQELLVSLEIETDGAGEERGDALNNVLDYDAILHTVRAAVRGRVITLQETLARDILTQGIAAYPQAKAAWIFIRKTTAHADTREVGVRFHWHRDAA